MPKKKKPYYPNNWQAIKDAPEGIFIDIPFDQFMDWKCAGWELPSSVSCIIREEDDKGIIKEYTYQRQSAAENKLKKLMSKGASIMTVVTDESIHQLKPHEEDYDDPLA